jgi:hypothetical protein
MAIPNAVFRHDLNTFVSQAADRAEMLIGLKVFPAYVQPARTGQYPQFTIANSKLLNRIATERGPTGEYGEIKRTFVRQTYDCVDRGLEERVDDTYKSDFARYFSAEQVAAEQTAFNVLLDPRRPRRHRADEREHVRGHQLDCGVHERQPRHHRLCW